ncbi:MAG: Zn-ribbon domain-containing OB-fold protein [Candidatus Hermodarchaeia archaeon]|jgi:uncharacterized OB-fold protein
MSEHEMGFVVELSSDVKNRQRMTAEFRPRFKCPCGGADLKWFEVNPEGTLYTWSIVHFAPDGIAKQTNVPYVVGVIEFEDELRLAAHMKGLTSKPKVGMKVKVAPQELENGNLAYFIKPA